MSRSVTTYTSPATTVVMRKGGAATAVVPRTQTITITQPPRGSGRAARRRRQRARRRQRQSNPGSAGGNRNGNSLEYDYISTLNDPFNCPPIRLGFGCLQRSELGRAYYKGNLVTTTSAGSTIAIFPTAAGMLSVCPDNSSASWSSISASNVTDVQAELDVARVVSFGVRAFALNAETNSPGIMHYGAIPPISKTDLSVLTGNLVLASPYLEPGPGSAGAIALGRPLDPDSFKFDTYMDSGTTSNLVPFSVPVISVTGVPTGTTIYVEAVVNFEYIPVLSGIVSIDAYRDNSSSAEPTLADTNQSVEQLFRRIRPLLRKPGIPGFINLASDAVEVLAQTTGRMQLQNTAGRMMYRN